MQALYQLREGGSDGRDNTRGLLHNEWPEEAAAKPAPLEDDVVEPPVVVDDIVQPPVLEGDVVEPPVWNEEEEGQGLWACEGVTCLNNGSCVVQDGYARCSCPLGFVGSYCEQGERH